MNAVLHVGVASGAPWGGLTWGGISDGVAPTGLRYVSAGIAVVSVLMAVVVLARAGVVARMTPVAPHLLTGVTWATAALMALGAVGNVAAAGEGEARWFAPIPTVLVGLTVYIAHRGEAEANRPDQNRLHGTSPAYGPSRYDS